MANVATATITTAVTLGPCRRWCEEPVGHPLDYLRRGVRYRPALSGGSTANSASPSASYRQARDDNMPVLPRTDLVRRAAPYVVSCGCERLLHRAGRGL